MTGQCDRAPRGWRCTRREGQDGPCAAERDGMFRGARKAIVPALVLWALIVAALLWWLGTPEVKPNPRTACERTMPPWAIAERCR